VVVDYSSEPPVVTDGPYGETKELFGGFYILDVASKEEAVEWAERSQTSGPGPKTEIRRVTSIEEFPCGELLTRLGRTDEAGAELELAVRLCGNERERTVLKRKLADLG
jgi:hypothetical protein